jgi:hypothetical protein
LAPVITTVFTVKHSPKKKRSEYASIHGHHRAAIPTLLKVTFDQFTAAADPTALWSKPKDAQ